MPILGPMYFLSVPWEICENVDINLANVKQKRVYDPPKLSLAQQTQNICITFIQCWINVGDVEPTLYKYYTNILCLLGVEFNIV